MALISAKTIITSISLFHITLGFFFLTNPITIADQAVVYVLGEAMGLPHVRSFESQSPALAFLAVILGIIGISDLVTLSLPDDMPEQHWGMQAPLRLSLSFFLSIYTFFFSAASPIYTSTRRLGHPSAHAHPPPGYAPSSWGGDALKNRVFFTFMFVETISWFWIWVTLQEERRENAARKAKRRSSHSHIH
ncbi:increased loss of mitochondrial DNA protein 1 [Echria macrotheca]|uniref:Increased loss of mitochondrial DNA protein 1 n=1 Tax=Echria macrotheca TaxID=438768 RepID=A0AAJ0B9T0_9PEZI|nr:increased loss of mitochondrial DNA protein 1 [Echria macrotheca]